MNNFVNTEKSLKRWLKNRVTVTTATVVGFLIMGTAVFAMDVNGKTVELKDNSFEITQEYIVGKQNVNGKTAGAIVTGKDAGEKLIISTALENKIENTEGWLLSVQSGENEITTEIGKDAVLSGKNVNRTTLNLWGKTTTVNNGIIEKAEKGWAAITISGAKAEGAKATFTNNGTVKGDINVEDNIILTNTGVIEGKIYADKEDGDKAITLSGTNAKVGAVELKGTGNTLEIKDGVNDTIDNVTGIDKIKVTDSTVTFSDGGIEKVITSSDRHLLDITNSNVTNKMYLTSNVTDSATTVGTSNLINNYGKTAGTYTLVNDGKLTSNNAASGIYTNANAEKAAMDVVNNGEVNIESNGWATGLNGKFDKEIKGAEISITNNGNITVTNGAGMDITNAGDESNKGTLINSEDGVITTSGFGVGMLADGKGMSAVNNGTIVINEATKHNDGRLSYGMQSKNGASVTNNGTIILEYADKDNVKAMGIGVDAEADGATGINNGKIKLSDVTDIENVKEDDLIKQLLGEKIEHKGMIVNKLGVNIFADANVGNENDITGSEVTAGEIGKDGVADKVTVGTAGATLKGDDQSLQADSFNVSGEVTITKDGSDEGVVIEDTTTNLDVNGKFIITDNAVLSFVGGTVNGEKEAETVVLGNSSTLSLDGTAFNGNIGGGAGTVEVSNAQIIGNLDVNSLNVSSGTEKELNVTYIDGEIGAKTITVGETVSTFADANTPNLPNDVKDILNLSSTSKFTSAGTLTINDTGKVVLGIGAGTDEYGIYNENALANSEVKVSVDGKGELQLSTDNISGETAVVSLGTSTVGADIVLTTDSDIYKTMPTHSVGNNIFVTLEYDKELYKENAVLNEINNAAAVLNGGTFSQKKAERKVQLDKIYSSNIYSETVRAAYDNVKMNEEAVESLAGKSQVGKWTAEGKALYSKNEYDRKGIVGDYSSEVESTGLIAAFGYGVNETTTAGVAFSGVKQDVDTEGGSADADLFYLGVYGNKVVGNYDFTAGLGYQFGEYDADNTIANVHGSDKYDTQALSGYVQGRYTADLGDGLSVQPKVRLGYTYIDQDNAKDSYFGVSDAEISTFDAEVGFDVVKSVQLEKSQADVRFGLSYTKAMGDTDKEFTGRFYGTEVSNGFDVLGAELAENIVKFNLGAEVSNENGFFYNGGFTYEFGSNDTEAYGVNVGVGYKF